jgi:hypothetical protein
LTKISKVIAIKQNDQEVNIRKKLGILNININATNSSDEKIASTIKSIPT